MPARLRRGRWHEWLRTHPGGEGLQPAEQVTCWLQLKERRPVNEDVLKTLLPSPLGASFPRNMKCTLHPAGAPGLSQPDRARLRTEARRTCCGFEATGRGTPGPRGPWMEPRGRWPSEKEAGPHCWKDTTCVCCPLHQEPKSSVFRAGEPCSLLSEQNKQVLKLRFIVPIQLFKSNAKPQGLCISYRFPLLRLSQIVLLLTLNHVNGFLCLEPEFQQPRCMGYLADVLRALSGSPQ